MTSIIAPSFTPSRPHAHARCAHCGLTTAISADGPLQFCCSGCAAAYQLIHSCGLDAYYAIRDRADSATPEARSSGRAYAEFDDPAFQRLYCFDQPDGSTQTDLLLEGIHCAACVWLVEKLPRVVPGVIEARLDSRRARVTVRFSRELAALSRIAHTLDSLGYSPHPARRAALEEVHRAEDRRMLVRVAVAGACAGNIMLLFFALYAGMLDGIEREHDQLFRWAAMILNTVCLAWPGLVFARSALAAIRTGSINLDVPIALGLYLGGVWGIWKTVAGHGDLYFDSISALIFFLLIGRMIQMRQQRFAADALELLFNIGPTSARRVNSDGSISIVATESLVPDDLVELRPGETAPSDGQIISGSSSFDQSMLSGESRPCRVSIGDPVAAGTINLSSPVTLRVEATGESTRIGRLFRLVEEAGKRRAAIVRLADRWGARLLWALLILAALTLIIWWPLSPAVAIDRAAALIIVTCPCGLGLATPLAMTVAIGLAARRGILVKGGDVFESLARSGGTIFLDKTGTITRGTLSLLAWHGDESAFALARALESHSSHPVARAIANAPLPDDRSIPALSDILETPGMGIRATALLDGLERCVAVGSERFLQGLGARFPEPLLHSALAAGSRGNSAAFIAIDGACVAVAELGDPLRDDAQSSIQSLQHAGWNVRILSGDRLDVVGAVAARLGLPPEDARGGATPEEKLAIVRDAAARGAVVMIGDGVNDAAALAAATVGIAVRGGAEASLAAADVSMKDEGLRPVVDLFQASRRVLRSIHFTIATSLFYNVVAASLAMTGLVSPLLAAIIMPASSLTVVAICLRSRPFSDRPAASVPPGRNENRTHAGRIDATSPIGARA